MRQTAVLVGIGLLGGWALVRLAQGVLNHVLFQVSSGDAAATVAAGLIMVGAAAVAALPPALRAMHLDPTAGLRSE